MKTLRGVYENGEIRLFDKMPVNGTKNVLVTFLEDEEEIEDSIIRNITLQQSTQTIKQYLNDEKEDLYQDFLK
jgi:hypothetical protein